MVQVTIHPFVNYLDYFYWAMVNPDWGLGSAIEIVSTRKSTVGEVRMRPLNSMPKKGSNWPKNAKLAKSSLGISNRKEPTILPQ